MKKIHITVEIVAEEIGGRAVSVYLDSDECKTRDFAEQVRRAVINAEFEARMGGDDD